MALEFFMDSIAVCSSDKNAKLICDKNCCIAKGILCKSYADVTEKMANIEYVENYSQ